MSHVLHVVDLHAIGWALVHFLWQGGIIGLLALALLHACRNRSSSLRCLVASAAMGICLLAFVVTLVWSAGSWNGGVGPVPQVVSTADIVIGDHVVDGDPPALEPGADQVEAASASRLGLADAPSGEVAGGSMQALLPMLALVWCLGILLMGIRFMRQWGASRRLRRSGVVCTDPRWNTLFDSIRSDLGIGRAVRLLQSTLAETPMVVGWFRPLVLVPASILTSLDEEELTLVFMHELTHVRRHDHLLNLLQGIVEILLFFHPVVWWLSWQVRIEREHCCDDATLRLGAEPGRLARTLVKLETIRIDPMHTNPIVLTASGGNFMNRIKRIVETPAPTGMTSSGRTPLALILGSLLVAVSIANIDSVEASSSSPVVQERDRGEERGRDADRGQERDERRGELDFPDAEEVMERASIAFEEGEITREQFSAIMKMHERFSMGIESGRMSVVDAARGFFDRVERMMEADGRDERDEREDDDVARRVGMMMVELGMAVDSGDMSPEDAIRKVMDLARRMRVDTTPEHAPADQRRARAAYVEAAEKMKAMLEAGEITREQMEERLEGMKRRMAMASGAERKPSITKADYEEASAKMLKMVEAGKISREQMQQRLDEMKRIMVEGAGSKRTMSKEDYDRAVDRMVEAVKAGEMTREQMQERLDRLNKELKGGDSKEQKKMTRADFDAAVEKMTKMVEAGEITREDMRRRLGEMRRMIADQSEESEKVDDPRKAYEALKRRLDMAVESGRMTQEQADERLAEFRRSLGR